MRASLANWPAPTPVDLAFGAGCRRTSTLAFYAVLSARQSTPLCCNCTVEGWSKYGASDGRARRTDSVCDVDTTERLDEGHRLRDGRTAI